MKPSVPAPVDRLPTGIDGLDAVLNGGLLRGAAYIVHGSPGAGKTILSNQICFGHTSRGEAALYVSLFAESHDRMIRFMQRMGFFMPEHIPERLVYLSAYSALMKDGLPGVLGLITAEARKRNATLVIFDGLFVAQDAAVNDQSFRAFVHELQGIASMLGATLLLLTNQRRDPSSPEYTMVDGWLELCDESEGLRSVRSLEVHKQRGGSFMRGRHFFRITDNGIEVFPRVEVAFKGKPGDEIDTRRESSGIAGLDAMLRGGYPATSATLIHGPTGAGKTTLGLHFAGGATKDAPALFYTFYESPRRLMAKAADIGIDAERLVAEGALRIHWRSPAENLADEIIHEIVREIQATGTRRLFVDGLHSLKSALMVSERLPYVVNALNHCLKSFGVTSLYSLESRELYRPTNLELGELSALVNNVILAHYARDDEMLRRNISILKVRDSDFDPMTREFYITSGGVVLAEDKAALPGGKGPRSGSAADTAVNTARSEWSHEKDR